MRRAQKNLQKTLLMLQFREFFHLGELKFMFQIHFQRIIKVPKTRNFVQYESSNINRPDNQRNV